MTKNFIARKMIRSKALLSIFSIFNANATSFINPGYNYPSRIPEQNMDELLKGIRNRLSFFGDKKLVSVSGRLNRIINEYEINQIDLNKSESYSKCHSKEHTKGGASGNGTVVGGGGSFSKEYSKEANCRTSLFLDHDSELGLTINVEYPQLTNFKNHDLFKKLSLTERENLAKAMETLANDKDLLNVDLEFFLSQLPGDQDKKEELIRDVLANEKAREVIVVNYLNEIK